jgi:hypothetical protein
MNEPNEVKPVAWIAEHDLRFLNASRENNCASMIGCRISAEQDSNISVPLFTSALSTEEMRELVKKFNSFVAHFNDPECSLANQVRKLNEVDAAIKILESRL